MLGNLHIYEDFPVHNANFRVPSSQQLGFLTLQLQVMGVAQITDVAVALGLSHGYWRIILDLLQTKSCVTRGSGATISHSYKGLVSHS